MPPCQPAKPTPEATASLQALELLAGDLAHRPHLADQVIGEHFLGVQIDIQGVVDFYLIPGVAHEGGKDIDALLGLVPIPTAPDEHHFLHIIL